MVINHPQLFIAGRWCATDRSMPVINPYDNSVIAEVPVAGEEEVSRAIAGARSGAEIMRRLPAHQRGRILYRTAELIEQDADRFTDLIIAEAGKPRKFARIEVSRAIETVRLAAEEAKRICGATVPMDAAPGSEKRRGFYIRVPVGIIAAITPFNFPLNLVMHKVAPAIAAGNAVILKPASKTPLTALYLAELLLAAGLPPEALNVVVGPGDTVGSALVNSRDVAMVTFTGSAAVGETLRRQSGIKKITLELGSNSGAIVDETANLDRALERCLVGAFAYSGQVCNHTQRLIVQQDIADEFINRFLSLTSRLVIGNPKDAATDIGPLIDERARKKAAGFVEDALSAGAQLLCGGRAEGTIFLPTVLTRVEPAMPVVCEETFAPIVTIETFGDFNEAITRFNNGSRLGKYRYGISAGVFTRDINRAWQAIEELDVASVYINDSATFRVDLQPYGGVKDSGIGREGPRFAVEEMTEIKMVSFNLDA